MAEENKVPLVVIFVDDDPAIRRALVRLARRLLPGVTVLAPEDLSVLRGTVEAHPRAVVVFDGNCSSAYWLDGWALVPTLQRVGWTGEALALTGERRGNLPHFLAAGMAAERVFEKPAGPDFWECLRALVQKGN